jgi:hypothetical protein
MSAHALSDYRAKDLGLSIGLGVVMLASAAMALRASAVEGHAAIPEIDPGAALPVRVTPVIDVDAPLLKLGGQRDTQKLPDRVVRPVARPRAEQRAYVSSKAGKAAQDAPAPDVKMAPADAKPPPPETELAKQVDTPSVAPVEAPTPANVDQPGHADGVKEGTEVNPLKARAVDLYRAKIAAWFSSRFRVSGSGLAKQDLLRYRVSASVSVGPDRTVSGFTVVGSGNATFDAAAHTALESARGQALPPPPENYPDVAQNRISVTFVCRENRCD